MTSHIREQIILFNLAHVKELQLTAQTNYWLLIHAFCRFSLTQHDSRQEAIICDYHRLC